MAAKVMLMNWWFQVIAAGEGTDFWAAVTKIINETRTNLVKISWGIFALAIVVVAIMFVGGRSMAEIAKSTLGKVVIAVILVSFATAIISTLASMSGQQATFGMVVGPLLDSVKSLGF
jgi:hypothetical protein